MRKQMVDSYESQLKARDAKAAEIEEQRDAEAEAHNQTLMWLAFPGAADLFGPTGSTVLMPAIARSYFGKHVVVVKDEQTGRRHIEVRDAQGNTMLDPKTGKAMAFTMAMEE